jgi:DNA replication protein DnaC
MKLIRTRDSRCFWVKPFAHDLSSKEAWENADEFVAAPFGGGKRRKGTWEDMCEVYDRAQGIPYIPTEDELQLIAEADQREHFARCGVPPLLCDCTFDNYDAHEQWQQTALDICRDFCRRDPVTGFLALVGPPGTGKDHLAVAIMRQINHPRSVYVTQADLMAEVHDGYGESGIERVIERVRNASVLVLSEVGSHGESIARDTHEVLYRILGHRYENFLPTVLTSNLRISGGNKAGEVTLRDFLGDRIASRISQALFAAQTLYGPDYRKTNQGRSNYLEFAQRALTLQQYLTPKAS